MGGEADRWPIRHSHVRHLRLVPAAARPHGRSLAEKERPDRGSAGRRSRQSGRQSRRIGHGRQPRSSGPVPAFRLSKAGDKASRQAEQIWRGGPPPGRARRLKLRRLFGPALTVVLLAASGVVLYMRFHHTPPVQVTSVTIAQPTRIACGVDVTGRITTNGAAGTVSYQWLVQPGRASPGRRPCRLALASMSRR